MYVVDTGFKRPFTNAVCVKWHNLAGTREVSVAADNSCGAMDVLGRCDIRCYETSLAHGTPRSNDVTGLVFDEASYGTTIHASNEAMRQALAWLGD